MINFVLDMDRVMDNDRFLEQHEVKWSQISDLRLKNRSRFSK